MKDVYRKPINLIVPERCIRGPIGLHRWVSEHRVSGAGKTFVTKLNPKICEYCGAEKYA